MSKRKNSYRSVLSYLNYTSRPETNPPNPRTVKLPAEYAFMAGGVELEADTPFVKAMARIRKLEAEVKRLGDMADALLNHCSVGECMECSVIVCPHKEPLHLHHDGCPACFFAGSDG